MKKVSVEPVKARLKEWLAEVAVQYGFEILAVEVMPWHVCRDHVHLFVSTPPTEHSSAFSPAEIVRLFNGITSCRLKKEFLDAPHPQILRRQYLGELGMYAAATLRATGYYIGTDEPISQKPSNDTSWKARRNSFKI